VHVDATKPVQGPAALPRDGLAASLMSDHHLGHGFASSSADCQPLNRKQRACVRRLSPILNVQNAVTQLSQKCNMTIIVAI